MKRSWFRVNKISNSSAQRVRIVDIFLVLYFFLILFLDFIFGCYIAITNLLVTKKTMFLTVWMLLKKTVVTYNTVCDRTPCDNVHPFWVWIDQFSCTVFNETKRHLICFLFCLFLEKIKRNIFAIYNSICLSMNNWCVNCSVYCIFYMKCPKLIHSMAEVN